MSDWFGRLSKRFEDESQVLDAGHGRLLVTQIGARVLGCEMPGVDGNLFWHPCELEERDAATGGVSVDISGGDRLWIAPEVAYYWPSLDKARQDPVKWGSTPPQVDPGEYECIDADERGIHLATEMTLTDARVDKKISLLVDREVFVIEPPRGLPAALKVCSLSIVNTLSLEDGDDGAVAGAWDILQVPPTGTLTCPTVHPVEPTSYYEPFGPRHVRGDERCMRFLVDGKRRIKMGIPAAATTGRMGYYRPLPDGVSSLIVRVFAPLPGEPYVDVPRSADAATRFGEDALQAYNDDGSFGGFGEMEYHDPALVVDSAAASPITRTGTCVTHILTGPDADIREAGQHLLGAPVEAIG